MFAMGVDAEGNKRAGTTAAIHAGLKKKRTVLILERKVMLLLMC